MGEKMKRYLTQENQRNNNLCTILQYITEQGAASRREIQQETGFSWGTVSEAAADLIGRGFLAEEKDTRRGGVGRTGTVLKPTGEKIALIGLDVNLSGMTAEVLGFDRTVKHTIRRPFTARDQKETVAAVQSLCAEAVAFCAGKYRVFSIGLAVQGAVDNAAGVSVRFPLPGEWIPCSFKQILEDAFRVFTYADHDPKCMLLAAAHTLRADARAPAEDLMLIRVDRGIGLSVMQGGRIAEDVDKMELGHTLSVYRGLPCKCGRRGCLEAYASIAGIERRCGVPFAEVLADPAQYGGVLEEAAHHLAVAVHNAAMLFYPQRIIFTGDALREDPDLLPRFAKIFNELEEAAGRRPIELHTDCEVSAALGAAIKASTEAIRELCL